MAPETNDGNSKDCLWIVCVLSVLALTASPMWCDSTEVKVTPVADEAATSTQQDQNAAATLARLLATPGLMSAVPSSVSQTGEERSKLFFEIGRCYYALGDSARAGQALRYAYALYPDLETTVVAVQSAEARQAQAFVADLGLTERRQKYAGTSKIRAAGRSMIFPGWGQIYRGHKKRGLITMGTTLAAGAFLATSVKSYNSAKRAYDQTLVSELNLDALDTGAELERPFESRYKAYESKASRANAAAFVLAAVWGAAILDNFVLEPNRFVLEWEIGR